jgi:hypothetical protein
MPHVVFGHMLPSAAATESRLPIRGNPENEIASFRGFEPQNLAVSNQQIDLKQTLAQDLTSWSRLTRTYLKIVSWSRSAINVR